MHHQPLGWIERNRIGLFNAFQPNPILGANECAASVRSVYMQPNLELVANVSNLRACENKSTATMSYEQLAPAKASFNFDEFSQMMFFLPLPIYRMHRRPLFRV